MRQRGFEPVIESMRKGNGGFFLPRRATKKSAAYDLISPEVVVVYPHDKATIHTNIKAYMLDDEVLMGFVRSSMGVKYDIALANTVGIIDAR